MAQQTTEVVNSPPQEQQAQHQEQTQPIQHPSDTTEFSTAMEITIDQPTQVIQIVTPEKHSNEDQSMEITDNFIKSQLAPLPTGKEISQQQLTNWQKSNVPSYSQVTKKSTKRSYENQNSVLV
ncbi:24663_t:CDS:2 [Dentiscutata erythropus]|uniref:24663_t:CDS:1 n=1 Tax=Dentiscutata erythropus TaxID=1348616 RepID=A0A9N8ZZW4_9GLOM|nr:24663_t:CDS:2 [Dentiscutata erythropus]